MNFKKILLCFMIVFLPPSLSFAQFSGSNQANYQIGNQPSEEPSNRTNLYNQLNLRYNSGKFSFGLRAEVYNADSQYEYNRFSQKYIRFNTDGLRIQFGNFYESFGKGLLLRTYEIPGSVYEEGGTQQRYGFYKDIEGLSIRFENDLLSTKFLIGRPLNFLFPPDFGRKQRRESLVQGGEVNVHLLDEFTPGILYLRQDRSGMIDEFAGLNFDAYLSDEVQLYAEYVQNGSSQYDIFAFGDKSPHAFYGSTSISLDFVTVTAEYKDYNEFTLVFNDPPPSIREHSFTLLNRATHASEPLNEEGYQLEFLFNIEDLNTATLNHSMATNKFGNSKFEFYEYYADVNYYFDDATLGKVFLDYSQDELVGQFKRYTGGLYFETAVVGLWSSAIEVQGQQFKREFKSKPKLNHNTQNFLFSLFASYAPDFSIGGVLELTDDRLENDRLLSENPDVFLSYPSITASYQYDQSNTVSLFYGKRRGGNACTGGVCYQVLPFEGIELKLNTRF